MNYNQFGNSKAAKILVEQLIELNNHNVSRRVSKFFRMFCENINVLKTADRRDSRAIICFAHLFYSSQREFIINNQIIPLNIRTLLINIIKVKYKAFLVEMDASTPKKLRK